MPSSPSSSVSAPAVTAVAQSPQPSAGGRLSVLTAYAVAAGAVPIPFVPDRLIARVRGAVVQDVAARRGMSLTSEARAILAEPVREQGARALVRKAAELVTQQFLRRVGPLFALNAAVRGLEVFALGMLFDRYLGQVRSAGTVRIHAAEATKVRDAIDKAVLRSLSLGLQPTPTTEQGAVEDLRDEYTRWIDSLLLTGAALPDYLRRRLESAFDEVARANPDLSHG